MVGPVGTGKTSVAQGVLQRLDPQKFNLLTVNLSAQVRLLFRDYSPVYMGLRVHEGFLDSTPDSDHLSRIDCDPDFYLDSGPGSHRCMYVVLF